MTTEQQNRIWKRLPKYFKNEVLMTQAAHTPICYDLIEDNPQACAVRCVLESLFGSQNIVLQQN